MSTIEIKRELSKEFLSDVMITAFDGHYGAVWTWAEPVGRIWLETEQNPEDMDPDHSFWMKAHIRVSKDEPTGNPLFDREDGFAIDHDSLAAGMARIINDDYEGVWRPATPSERDAYSSGLMRGRRETKFINEVLHVHMGETARGLRDQIMFAVNEEDAGEIDADCADAIVQAAAFGKVIFG